MIVTNLKLYRGAHDFHTEMDKPLTGKITVAGNGQETTFNLDERASKRIVELIADEIIDAAKVVSKLMVADMIEAKPTKKIESK